MLYVVMGLIQSLIICVGDLLLLGVQCKSPAAFIFAGLFTSFVYVNIIYALSITFKHIGKAVSVILVIIQIPGSAGTYPIRDDTGVFPEAASAASFYIRNQCDERSGSRNIWIPLCREFVVSCSVCSDCAFDRSCRTSMAFESEPYV